MHSGQGIALQATFIRDGGRGFPAEPARITKQPHEATHVANTLWVIAPCLWAALAGRAGALGGEGAKKNVL